MAATHKIGSAALAGVILGGLALVFLTGLFLWIVHFRQKKSEKKKFRTAGVSARLGGSKNKHQRIEEVCHEGVHV
jgi:hypothetical protein